ncbi:hypothetical protein DFA_05956 [Cavenderia fasciculata]|uniref:RING-type E3 ubiquitin transferase n=1 Tax=Cavenderia fasciculata TaxID=261658 RepID=F4PJP6_CACFS|nr:uncharacterized protein DFA_05956 [Cavenderia fasciculata]EGG23820.1 hypothetical protein DFA_05956 [Cavenderia fasciculata]|eukprot:XP_004361671.1 hypothetical protein DFA_05956 [Cavenderia fasciculata]
MGIISSRSYYPREDDEGVGQVDPTTSNAGGGGGGRGDEEMAYPMTSLSSSLLPQLFNTPVVYSKIAIRKDTIKVVRVDKNNNNSSSSTSSSNTGVNETDQEQDKVVIITKLQQPNYHVDNEEDSSNNDIITSTTSTTATTNNNNNNNNNNESIDINERFPTIENYDDDNNNNNTDITLQVTDPSTTSTTSTTTTTTTTTAKVINTTASKSTSLEPIVITEGIYNIKFKFDSEEPCVIDIYLLAHEADESDTINECNTHLGPFHFSRGLDQSFSLSNSEYIDVSKFSTKDLTTFAIEKVQYPLIITLKTVSYLEDPSSSSSSTSTTSTQKIIRCQYSYLTLLACDDYTYDVKALKQKNFIDSKTSYITHDIYGYHSNSNETPGNDDDKLCLTCMSEERDTLLIPCRHFYLCANCAREIKGRCPLCRSIVGSILKVSKKDLELHQLQHNNQQFLQQQQQEDRHQEL